MAKDDIASLIGSRLASVQTLTECQLLSDAVRPTRYFRRVGLTRVADANESAKLTLKQGEPPIRRNEQPGEWPSSKLTIIKLNCYKFSPMIVGGM